MRARPALAEHAHFCELLHDRRTEALLRKVGLFARFEEVRVDAGVEALGKLRTQHQGRFRASLRVRWGGKDRQSRLATPRHNNVLEQFLELVERLRL